MSYSEDQGERFHQDMFWTLSVATKEASNMNVYNENTMGDYS